MERIDAEIRRLRALSSTLAPVAAALNQARTEIGWLARFDPTPERVLARRYEAAAERGMYRAIRAIADGNRCAEPGEPAKEPPAPPDGPRPQPDAFIRPPRVPNPPPQWEPRPGDQPGEPLGSFRLGRPAAGDVPFAAPAVPLDFPARPRKRPDLRKLAENRSANRR